MWPWFRARLIGLDPLEVLPPAAPVLLGRLVPCGVRRAAGLAAGCGPRTEPLRAPGVRDPGSDPRRHVAVQLEPGRRVRAQAGMTLKSPERALSQAPA